jgi:single-strand DNA-binding protein
MATTKREIIMFIKLVTIGRDAELKNANGKPFLSLSAAYDVGYGQNKKTQWLSLTMWGQQAEKAAQHLTKGKQIVVNVSDLHVEEYKEKSYLKGTIQSFDFVRSGGGQQDKHNEDKSNGYQPQKQQQNNNWDDSDLPF